MEKILSTSEAENRKNLSTSEAENRKILSTPRLSSKKGVLIKKNKCTQHDSVHLSNTRYDSDSV